MVGKPQDPLVNMSNEHNHRIVGYGDTELAVNERRKLDESSVRLGKKP